MPGSDVTCLGSSWHGILFRKKSNFQRVTWKQPPYKWLWVGEPLASQFSPSAQGCRGWCIGDALSLHPFPNKHAEGHCNIILLHIRITTRSLSVYSYSVSPLHQDRLSSWPSLLCLKLKGSRSNRFIHHIKYTPWSQTTQVGTLGAQSLTGLLVSEPGSPRE